MYAAGCIHTLRVFDANAQHASLTHFASSAACVPSSSVGVVAATGALFNPQRCAAAAAAIISAGAAAASL